MVTITPHPQTHLKHYKILSKKGVLTVHRSVVNVIQSRGVKMAPRVVKIDDPRIDSPRLIFTHEPRCGSKEINSFAREGNSSCARAQFEPTNLITLSKVRDLIYRLAHASKSKTTSTPRQLIVPPSIIQLEISSS